MTALCRGPIDFAYSAKVAFGATADGGAPAMPLHLITFSIRNYSNFLENNPLDLIKGDLVVAAIVEFGRARAFVCRHLLGVFE